MLREMGARQLYEWFAFSSIEGFGEKRADLRMGILASLIANVHRDAKRKPTPFRPKDFIPRTKEDEARDAAQDLRVALDAIAKPKRKP